MAGYRDLPMGRHDEAVLSSPETRVALGKLVASEKAVIALLQERVAEFEGMLGTGNEPPAASADGASASKSDAAADTPVTDSQGV